MIELYGATAPVFTVDGQVHGELARDLARLDVEETTAGLKTLTARFIAVGERGNTATEQLLYLDGALLDFGKPIEVSIGRSDDQRVVFKGLISGLEADFIEGAPAEVVVFAEDALMKLRMTRRMRTYRNITDAGIAEAIATAHGLTADTAADGPTYDVVQQWNQSDLAFLRERARLLQAEVWIRDDTLYFQTRGRRAGTEITVVEGNELLQVQLRADLAHQRTAVRVAGYDADRRDAVDEEAGAATIQSEVSEGRTGPDVLRRALGDRVSHRVREAPLRAGDARAWAQAEMLRRSRAFVTAVGTTSGTPTMSVGSRLRLERVGAPFEGGGYYVTRCCHTYDLKYGHRTHFEAERATVNEAA